MRMPAAGRTEIQGELRTTKSLAKIRPCTSNLKVGHDTRNHRHLLEDKRVDHPTLSCCQDKPANILSSVSRMPGRLQIHVLYIRVYIYIYIYISKIYSSIIYILYLSVYISCCPPVTCRDPGGTFGLRKEEPARRPAVGADTPQLVAEPGKPGLRSHGLLVILRSGSAPVTCLLRPRRPPLCASPERMRMEENTRDGRLG